MKNKQAIVTTSWDDGHRLDTKLARLLKKYDMPATFYISPREHEFAKEDRLTDKEIIAISKDFEIGAHTMSHPHLSQISLEEADFEIKESKKYLEELIGKKVVSFCYPYGDYNQDVAKLVKKNGYILARTVKRYSFEKPVKPFEMETTFHTYNHYSDIHKIAAFASLNPERMLRYTNWEYLAMDLFDKAVAEKLVFHLWAHSWEIEKLKGWEKLENVFKYIAHRKDITYATNAELVL